MLWGLLPLCRFCFDLSIQEQQVLSSCLSASVDDSVEVGVCCCACVAAAL